MCCIDEKLLEANQVVNLAVEGPDAPMSGAAGVPDDRRLARDGGNHAFGPPFSGNAVRGLMPANGSSSSSILGCSISARAITTSLR
jgi:hypothetical protein